MRRTVQTRSVLPPMRHWMIRTGWLRALRGSFHSWIVRKSMLKRSLRWNMLPWLIIEWETDFGVVVR